MRHWLYDLFLSSLNMAAPRVPDASEAQRLTAARALPAAISADPVPMDLSGAKLGRIFYGDTLPAQTLVDSGFPQGVQSGVGVGTKAWPSLPKRRVDRPLP